MIYTIYSLRNRINSKIYIGYSSKTAHRRFCEHVYGAFEEKLNRVLDNALRKYGAEAFEITELACTKKLEDAWELERQFIVEYKSFPPELGFGYNMTAGGQANSHLEVSEEARYKMGSARRGVEVTPATKAKMREAWIRRKQRGKLFPDYELERRSRVMLGNEFWKLSAKKRYGKEY